MKHETKHTVVHPWLLGSRAKSVFKSCLHPVGEQVPCPAKSLPLCLVIGRMHGEGKKIKVTGIEERTMNNKKKVP